jgi:hypothetical protein
VLYEEVERAFVGLDRVAQAAEQIRAMRRGTLRVAGSPAVALDLLPNSSRVSRTRIRASTSRCSRTARPPWSTRSRRASATSA